MGLVELKKEYNHWNKRYKNAEDYFRVHTVEECEKHIPLVHEILRGLSTTCTKIEQLLNREMTSEEKENGFGENQL